MNELIFLAHLLFVIVFILIGKRVGKEALMGLFALQLIICNIFLSKQITLAGFNATACDAYCIGCLFCLSIIQNQFGAEAAKKTIKMGFLLVIFFGIASQFQLHYRAHPDDWAHPFYHSILSLVPKYVATSLIVNFSTQTLTIYLNTLFSKFSKIPLFLRLITPIAIAQLFDTIAFCLIALVGVMSNVVEVITISYTIKIIAILILSPSLFLANKAPAQTGNNA